MHCNFLASLLSKMMCNLDEASYEQDGTRRQAVAAAPIAGGSLVAAWSNASRGRSARECDAHDGVGVECATAGRWIGCTEATSARSAIRAGGCAAPGIDEGVEGWSIGRWLSHRSVDAAARRPAHRAALRALVQREPGVAHPRLGRLLLPATFRSSPRARRDGDQAMEADALASSKKTPQNKAESSSS
jgi:hypothetical protein